MVRRDSDGQRFCHHRDMLAAVVYDGSSVTMSSFSGATILLRGATCAQKGSIGGQFGSHSRPL